MPAKIIDCIFKNGVFKPIENVHLQEGAKAKVILKDERNEILDKYAGAIKLNRVVTTKEILELEDEACQY
ncbi:MAG: antitoxin family protein [Methanotrichaceae archaeon]|nr:antitoxin family protein [Methanotrichaceae archaeon]